MLNWREIWSQIGIFLEAFAKKNRDESGLCQSFTRIRRLAAAGFGRWLFTPGMALGCRMPSCVVVVFNLSRLRVHCLESTSRDPPLRIDLCASPLRQRTVQQGVACGADTKLCGCAADRATGAACKRGRLTHRHGV